MGMARNGVPDQAMVLLGRLRNYAVFMIQEKEKALENARKGGGLSAQGEKNRVSMISTWRTLKDVIDEVYGIDALEESPVPALTRLLRAFRLVKLPPLTEARRAEFFSWIAKTYPPTKS